MLVCSSDDLPFGNRWSFGELKMSSIARALLIAGIAIALCVRIYFGGANLNANSNEILLGANSTTSPFNVPFYEPQSLSGSSKEDISALRAGFVDQQMGVLANAYTLSSVFDGMPSNFPWLGMTAALAEGPSPHGVDGASFDSRSVLNPYLLIFPDFWGLSIWSGLKLKSASEVGYSPERLVANLYLKPKMIHLDPSARIGTVTYNLREFLASLSSFFEVAPTLSQANFSLNALNARDLGFNYYFLDLPDSKNISNSKQPLKPLLILDQLAHSYGTCDADIDCVSSVAAPGEFDSIQVDSLPATASINLWKSNPGDDTSNPDMVFSLEFN